MKRRPIIKSIETKYYEERDALFQGLHKLDRRSFMKVSMAAMGAAVAEGVEFNYHGFLRVRVVNAAETSAGDHGFTFAYLSDSHLYERELNDRFIRQLLRAVDDINDLEAQPDFVLFGGDLAQLGGARGTQTGRRDPEKPQGAREDDGRRTRLVFRPWRAVDGPVR